MSSQQLLCSENFTQSCSYSSYSYELLVTYLIFVLPGRRILNLVHEVDKGETEILSSCAHHLRRLTQFSAAAEVYEKMEDTKSLITLYVETHQWDNVRGGLVE